MIKGRIAPCNKRLMMNAAGMVVVTLSISSCSGLLRKPVPPLNPPDANKEPAMAEAVNASKVGTVTRMPLGTLYQLVQRDAALIYDVRPSVIHKLGNIPGSISFPKSNFERDISKHEPRIVAAIKNHTPVVIYCTDLACPDAITVATKLSERGYDVSVLQGGYDAWKSATE